MKDYKVLVTCALVPGYTADAAEVDEGTLGEHEYLIEDACCPAGAAEKALDDFHGHHAIGVLDYVEINTQVEGGGFRELLEVLLADHIAMSKDLHGLKRGGFEWSPLPIQETVKAALEDKYMAPLPPPKELEIDIAVDSNKALINRFEGRAGADALKAWLAGEGPKRLRLSITSRGEYRGLVLTAP